MTISCTTEWSSVSWWNPLSSQRYTRESPTLTTANARLCSCSTTANAHNVVPIPSSSGLDVDLTKISSFAPIHRIHQLIKRRSRRLARSTGKQVSAAVTGPSLDLSLYVGNQHFYRQGRSHFSALVTSQAVSDREDLSFNQHRVFVFLSTSASIGGLSRL